MIKTTRNGLFAAAALIVGSAAIAQVAQPSEPPRATKKPF